MSPVRSCILLATFSLGLPLLLAQPGRTVAEPLAADAAETPPHLEWARLLLDQLDPADNEYGSHPTYLTWEGVDGASRATNRTVGSTFITHLLRQAYRLSDNFLRAWMGSTAPNAAAYHDAIELQHAFTVVEAVPDARPGDLLAISYGADDSTKASGHVLLIAETPVLRFSDPSGDTYDVAVIDSCRSGHGRSDTRRRSDGSYSGGVGQGILRLYADPDGRIVGHSWSDSARSTFRPQSLRHAIIGRLELEEPEAGEPPPDAANAHLAWAVLLVDDLDPDHNEYGSNPTYLAWAGVDGALETTNRTVCSTFVTALLEQAYQLSNSDFSAWMGSASPYAKDYHDAIVAENGFRRIDEVADAEEGDVIAIEYLDGSSSSTGHVAIIAATPELVQSDEAGNVYEVTIIDSSRSGHGPSDTRRLADGSYTGGVGEGVMRLYTDPDDRIVGYTWSNWSNSTYHDQADRDTVIGRLQLDR